MAEVEQIESAANAAASQEEWRKLWDCQTCEQVAPEDIPRHMHILNALRAWPSDGIALQPDQLGFMVRMSAGTHSWMQQYRSL